MEGVVRSDQLADREVVQFYYVLDGFWAGQGTGTAPLEAKMFQNMTQMSEEVLYKIFLELHKTHEKIEREKCMEILVGYGVGPWMERILKICCDNPSMMARSGH